MTGSRAVVYPLAAFTVWTLTSFLCHKLAKMALTSFSENMTSFSSPVAPLIVTLWQVTSCYATVTFTSRRGRLFFVMVTAHTVATLSTNTSLSLLFASSAVAVKLLEPVTSALMQSLILKAPLRAEKALSMVVIVVGAVMFVGDPLQDRLVAKGLWMALLSNVILGLRNVAIKLDQSGKSETTFRSAYQIASYGVATFLVISVVRLMEATFRLVPAGATYFLLLCLASSACHVTYSYVSTNVILRCMSVVSHAVANIVKRVLVVLLLHLSGWRLATLWNWAGLVICTCGLFLYNLRTISASVSPPPPQPQSASASHSLPVSFLRKPENRGNDSHQDSAKKALLLYRLLLVCLSLYLLCFLPIHHLPDQHLFAQHLPVRHLNTEHLPTQHLPTQHLPAQHLPTQHLPSQHLAIQHLPTQHLPAQHLPNQHLPKPDDYAGQLRHGLVTWRDGQPLLKAPVTFQPLEKDDQKVETFLRQNLTDIPWSTDQLSPYLTTSRQVVQEATRVHLNLLSGLVGKKTHAILIGAASFENKGDPAITVGQLRVLEKLGLELVFYINEVRCTDENYRRAVSAARPHSREDLVIFMQGGGNIIGYPGANFCREKAFGYFPGYQVILLSQSVMMMGSRDLVDRMVSIYCCRPQLTIFLRDRLSLSIASRLFTNGTRLILAPDMAFGVGEVRRFSPPFYDVLWLKRKDGERLRYDALPAFPPGVTVHVADWFHSGWDTPQGSTTVETAHHVLMNGLLFLQRGRVVVTERLHGHILSTLLDVPHVLLDNPHRKLSSYHRTWTRGVSNARLATTPEEAVRMAVELLSVYGSSLPPIFPGMAIKEHGEKP